MTRKVTLATLLLAGFCATGFAAPATMQAIVQGAGEGPEALRLQTVDTPTPGAGEVLVRVVAAGVNPVDWKRLPSEVREPGGRRRAAIPGYDVAGIVDSVGSGVTALKPGDAVYARADRAFAEYVAVAASDAVRKPARLTFIEAAASPIAGAAGYGSVEEARLQRGQRLAVIGAAGGAGSAAVVLAKARGARIIAVGHSSQQAYLAALGADEFVAYDRDDVAARVHDVDAVINTVDSQAAASLGYVRSGGRFVSIAGTTPEDVCATRKVTCVRIAGNAAGLTYPDSLRALAKLADDGVYRVRILKTFPLAQAADAQRLLRAGDVMGKVVLTLDARAGER